MDELIIHRMAARTPDRRPRSPARASGAEAARKPPPGKRAPGRPGADAPELRPRLLDAALACYVDKGIAATSLRDIARRKAETPKMPPLYRRCLARHHAKTYAARALPST